MDFVISCPHCQQKMQVKEEWINNSITCPMCQQDLIIPVPDSSMIPPSPPAHNTDIKMPDPTKKSELWAKFSKDPLSVIGKFSALIIAFLALAAIITGICFGIRINSAINEREEISIAEKADRKKLTEQISRDSKAFYDKESELSRQRKYKELSALRTKFYKDRQQAYESLDKKYNKIWKEYKDEYEELITKAGTNWKSIIYNSLFLGMTLMILCLINWNIFPVIMATITKMHSSVSSRSIIYIIQLLYCAAMIMCSAAAINSITIFWGLAIWFGLMAAVLFKPGKFGISVDENSTLFQDAVAWIILPLKISLYLTPLFIAFGAIILAVMIFQMDYDVSSFITKGIFVSILPLAKYLCFLFSIYIVEIGLAIIAIPQNLQNRDQ